MGQTKQISTILFDLGGVLIELDGPPIKDGWLDEPIDYRENWRRWGNSYFVKSYETGKISADEFIDGVLTELNLNVDRAVFKQTYIEWPKSFFPGADDLLKTLRTQYRLAFYSNTSDLHLPRLLNDIGLADYFDHTFASYEIGFFKPDRKGYEHVLEQMGVQGDEVLFIDDNPANVEGALAAGLRARQAFGLEEVTRVLEEEGCISSSA